MCRPTTRAYAINDALVASQKFFTGTIETMRGFAFAGGGGGGGGERERTWIGRTRAKLLLTAKKVIPASTATGITAATELFFNPAELNITFEK